MSNWIRSLTPWQLLWLSVNGMIGSAWMFVPLYAAQISGAGALWAWMLGGALSLWIAYAFAQLASLYPVAGGTAYFARARFGPVGGFFVSFLSWIPVMAMPAIEIEAVLQYAGIYVPWLMTPDSASPALSHWGIGVALALLLCQLGINCLQTHVFMRLNQALLLVKCSVVLITVVAFLSTQFHASNFLVPYQGLGHNLWDWQAVFKTVATGGILFAFTGFKHAVEMGAEAHMSERGMHFSIVGSVLLCLIIYLLLQITFIGVLQPEQLQNGWQALAFQGDMGPFVGLAALMGLGMLVHLLFAGALISPFGAGLVYMNTTARLSYAMAQSGYLPRWLAQLSPEGQPRRALVFNTLLACSLLLPFPGWKALSGFLVSALLVSYGFAPLACWLTPASERTTPSRAQSMVYLTGFVLCSWTALWVGWFPLCAAAGSSLLAFVFVAWHTSETYPVGHVAWFVVYLLGLLGQSYLGPYDGGNHTLHFGWDASVACSFALIMACWMRWLQQSAPSNVLPDTA